MSRIIKRKSRKRERYINFIWPLNVIDIHESIFEMNKKERFMSL